MLSNQTNNFSTSPTNDATIGSSDGVENNFNMDLNSMSFPYQSSSDLNHAKDIKMLNKKRHRSNLDQVNNLSPNFGLLNMSNSASINSSYSVSEHSSKKRKHMESSTFKCQSNTPSPLDSSMHNTSSSTYPNYSPFNLHHEDVFQFNPNEKCVANVSESHLMDQSVKPISTRHEPVLGADLKFKSTFSFATETDSKTRSPSVLDEEQDKDSSLGSELTIAAYNSFVRRVVDDTIDRSITFCEQPRHAISMLENILARAWPQLEVKRHRNRIRAYLKACRRNSKKNKGQINMKEPPINGLSVEARQMVSNALHMVADDIQYLKQLLKAEKSSSQSQDTSIALDKVLPPVSSSAKPFSSGQHHVSPSLHHSHSKLSNKSSIHKYSDIHHHYNHHHKHNHNHQSKSDCVDFTDASESNLTGYPSIGDAALWNNASNSNWSDSLYSNYLLNMFKLLPYLNPNDLNLPLQFMSNLDQVAKQLTTTTTTSSSSSSTTTPTSSTLLFPSFHSSKANPLGLFNSMLNRTVMTLNNSSADEHVNNLTMFANSVSAPPPPLLPPPPPPMSSLSFSPTTSSTSSSLSSLSMFDQEGLKNMYANKLFSNSDVDPSTIFNFNGMPDLCMSGAPSIPSSSSSSSSLSSMVQPPPAHFGSIQYSPTLNQAIGRLLDMNILKQSNNTKKTEYFSNQTTQSDLFQTKDDINYFCQNTELTKTAIRHARAFCCMILKKTESLEQQMKSFQLALNASPLNLS